MALGTMIVFGILAQIARKTGLISLFYITGFLGLLGAFVSRVWLVDRMPKEKAKALGIKEIWNAVSKNLSLKVSYVVTFTTRADVIVMATLYVVWAVYAGEKFGYTPVKATARSGIVMMVMSLVSLIAYPITGILLDRWGRIPVLITTLLMGGAGFCLTAILNNPFSPVMFLLVILLGAATYGAVPGAQVLATDASPKPMVGSILGGLNTMSPIGILLFLQVGGFLFDKIGYWSPFALKGIANLACALWIIAIRKRLVVPREQGTSA
jgi:MFS family permease